MIEPAGVVHEDVSCGACGYDLRGLATDGVCPECGRPVADSMRGVLLRHSAAAYVAGLHRGAMVVLISLGVRIIAMALPLALAATGVMRPTTASRAIAGGPGAAMLKIAATIGITAGWWMLSIADPGLRGVNDGARRRRWVRLAVGLELAAVMFEPVLVRMRPRGAALTGIGQLLWTLGPAIMTALVHGGVLLASIEYVRWLAWRFPDRSLTRMTGWQLWVVPAVWVAGLLCIGLGPLAATAIYALMIGRVARDLAITQKLIRERSRGGAGPRRADALET